MANATETTKRAAVWNPPRIHELYLGAVGSGTTHPPTTADWEGSKILGQPPQRISDQGLPHADFRRTRPLSLSVAVEVRVAGKVSQTETACFASAT